MKSCCWRFSAGPRTKTCCSLICGLYWSEDDNTYIAEMPELSGCMADGPTAAEALHNVELIAQEWIETARELGRLVPVPKGRLKYA